VKRLLTIGFGLSGLLLIAWPFDVFAMLHGISPHIQLARFPDRVVVQWNDSGPTKWANKTFGLLLSPVLSVAIGLLLGWIPQLDPKLRRNPEWSERSLGILRLAITTLISFVGILVAVYALGYHFNSAAIGINAVLLFFLVFGNYIGTFPPS
jgi:uncharacterized membrane protein